ncbi:ATP-dependent Clp protease ATP-binding subunit ClpX [bioreactor metagenome]|uniref:ATP-dependent Clp protease ATP-binding subunit ClpX n=1 Tax=bioreactor metagenome TaxID=1076179 RepID=A0A645D837_9ZZZZ
MKFGLIPELVGRLPIVTVLDSLDEVSLVRILKDPKNSLVKQYKAMFAMDNVELDIEDDALHEIAKKTIKLKSGARGLRSVVEQTLMETMYEVPSDPTIIKVIVDAQAVTSGKPKMEYGAVRKRYKNSVNMI